MRLIEINYKEISDRVMEIGTYFDSDSKAIIEVHTIVHERNEDVLRDHALI